MESTRRAAGVGETIPLAKRLPKAMAVIIRDKPATYDWGWFSREDPRLHLQTVDKQHRHLHYKVWLENRGRRVFEPQPGIPARVLRALKGEVAKQRGQIENEWIAFMIASHWLQARLTGMAITLYAYPQTPNHFERTINLLDELPDEAAARSLTPKDIVLDRKYAWLELYPNQREGLKRHIPLDRILWTDS